jgi:diaminopimelate epimerase
MTSFVKAHACGNDFLIVQEKLVAEKDQSATARRLCDRNRGVGADGVEFFSPEGERRGRIRLVNADGSVAEISGNGTRCVAAWLAHETGAGPGDDIVLVTDAGLRVCHIVAVDGRTYNLATPMGVPGIQNKTVTLATIKLDGVAVSTGNPHFVVFVDDPAFEVQGLPWQAVGKEICTHPDFPHQTNVEFVRAISPSEIEIRIYERGVGPTTSSGTGTCAAATAAIYMRGAEKALHVTAPGGTQFFHWEGIGSEMLLTGPAELICSGEAF